MPKKDQREVIVSSVIKEYHRQTKEGYMFLSETLRWAMLDSAVVTVLKAQDNQEMPISTFSWVHYEAFDRLFEGQ